MDKELFKNITSTLRTNEPLAGYTSWHIGGVAERYFRPENEQDLLTFLQDIPATEPLVWLGLGSNVLISDSGIAGTVIHTYKMAGECRLVAQDNDSCVIEVGAGVACAKVAKFAAKHGLIGAEFFSGIPGTVGGALAMNAGAFGGETWQHVQSVRVATRAGLIHTRQPNEYVVSYRSVQTFEQEWFLSAQLKFARGDVAAAQARIKELLQRRSATQPIGLLSCGSVFRNPTGKYAAELIEASKLKGRTIGNAQVSVKHANFILNLGGARAADVWELIEEIRQRVLVDHGVLLVPEVRVIG